MLVIRRVQIKAMSQQMREDFAERLAAHLREYFPEEAAALGPEELKSVVREGIERAEKHGLSADRDITRFLNLVFVFGRDFDRDPSLSWAGRLFARAGRMAPETLINRLYVQGLRHEQTGQGLNPGKR